MPRVWRRDPARPAANLVAAEARRFGFNHPTGIELPYEYRTPHVADPAWRTANWKSANLPDASGSFAFFKITSSIINVVFIFDTLRRVPQRRAPARSECVLVGTLKIFKQCHSVFDCKTTDLQLVRATGEGVVKKLGVIYRGIPDAQRLSTAYRLLL